MSGWFRLHRGWRDCDVFAQGEPFSEREAWLWLIEKAAWKACVRTNAKGERVKVERGQLQTSLRSLESAWGWGKNKIARFLQRLADHDMIGTVAGQSGMVLTICNFDKYQDDRDGQDAKTGTVAGQSRDSRLSQDAEKQQKSGSEEGKEGKEKEIGGEAAPGKIFIPSDWRPPSINDLPPQAKGCAEQWPADAYAAQAEEFAGYWRTARKKNTDWRQTWANHIIRQHSKVMRDAKFGVRYGPEPGKVVQLDPTARADTMERTAVIYDKQGRDREAAQIRQEAARLRKSVSIGDLVQRAIN